MFLSSVFILYDISDLKNIKSRIHNTCEYMKTDCEIDCHAGVRRLKSCLGHQITQGRQWCISPDRTGAPGQVAEMNQVNVSLSGAAGSKCQL